MSARGPRAPRSCLRRWRMVARSSILAALSRTIIRTRIGYPHNFVRPRTDLCGLTTVTRSRALSPVAAGRDAAARGSSGDGQNPLGRGDPLRPAAPASREALIHKGISDSPRGPAGLCERIASHNAVATGGADCDSRGFVRVKMEGVLDRNEEDVKMCVSGL